MHVAENKRFFPADTPAADKRHLALLRQEPLRRAALILLTHGEVSHADIVAALAAPTSTVSFYMTKLVDAGVVVRRRDGRVSRYSLVEPAAVHAILIRYRASFLDRLVDGFLASFDALGREKD